MLSRKVCRGLMVILAVGLLGFNGAEAVKAAQVETIDVVGCKGWVVTDAILPLAKEELKKQGIDLRISTFTNMVIRDKELMESKMHTGAFDVLLAWEALMPLMWDYIVPLDSFLEKDPEVDLAEFKNSLFTSALDLSSHNGKLHWLPIHTNGQIGVFRMDLFTNPKEREAFKKTYGYDLPMPDENGMISIRFRNQLVDIAQFFTRDVDKDGTIDLWGLDIPGKWDHGCCIFEEEILRAGLEYFDAEGHSLWGPAHPENQRIVEDIARFDQDLIQTYKVTPPISVTMEMTEVAEFYMEGKAAMAMTWMVDFWGDLGKPAIVKKIGKSGSFAPMFYNKKVGPGYRGILSDWGYGISVDSDSKEAAYKFIKLIADPEFRKKVALKTGLPTFPGNVEAARWLVKKGYAPAGGIEAVANAGSFWPVSNRPFPETEQVRDVVREAHEDLLVGKITPKEFVKVTGDKIEKIMKEAGYF